MKKTSKRYEIEKFWYEFASQKVWKYTHWRYETTLKRYEMMSKVWKNTNNTKVWNRCTRYEKCAQGMKNVHKVYNFPTKVWNAFLRYETRVFLKNSGFSYLYGSVSYLLGYENIGCFSLMLVHESSSDCVSFGLENPKFKFSEVIIEHLHMYWSTRASHEN